MKIGDLKTIVDAIYELHGPDANTTFVYQKASGRTGRGNVTSYRVSFGAGIGMSPVVQFNVDYPRGEDGPE